MAGFNPRGVGLVHDELDEALLAHDAKDNGPGMERIGLKDLGYVNHIVILQLGPDAPLGHVAGALGLGGGNAADPAPASQVGNKFFLLLGGAQAQDLSDGIQVYIEDQSQSWTSLANFLHDHQFGNHIGSQPPYSSG